MTTELMPAWNTALAKGILTESNSSKDSGIKGLKPSEFKNMLKKASWDSEEAIAILEYIDKILSELSIQRSINIQHGQKAASKIELKIESLNYKSLNIIGGTTLGLVVTSLFSGLCIDPLLFYGGTFYFLGAYTLSSSPLPRAIRKFLTGKNKIEFLEQELEAERKLTALKDRDLSRKQKKLAKKVNPVMATVNKELSHGYFSVSEFQRIEFQKHSEKSLTVWEEAL